MKIFFIPRNADTLIFDIDSTLYTNDDYAFEQVDCQIREMANLQNIPYDELCFRIAQFRANYAAAHNGAAISLGNTLVEFGVPIEQSIEWRRKLLEPERFLHADTDLQNALTLLQPHFTLVTVTNNPVLPAQKTLDALGVSDFFCGIIGLDTCGVSKPHRKPFECAVTLAKSQAGRCIAVGDRYDIDIALPLDMGMGGVLVDGVADVYRLPDLLCH